MKWSAAHTKPMRLPPGTPLAVSLHWDATTRVPVGRLAMRGRQLLFEFDRAFLTSGVEISPFRLRRQPGVLEPREPLFDNLPGVFADSLPDGWGRLLLDRAARLQGISPHDLTPLDRLAHVGHDGVGALVYVPELAVAPHDIAVDLDELAQATQAVLADAPDGLLDRLRQVGGSPQGARPKALVQVHDETERMTDEQHAQGPGWRHWLVKFAGQNDFFDIGPVELAYARMAALAGVQMPEVRLMPSRHGPGYFAAARFDRHDDARLHVATAAGLLHADYQMPSLDYVDLAKLTVRLTQDHREGERLFRLCAFNVLAHNRDDHAKQFSFTMDRHGAWRLAPAYDLTFAAGPGGEHSTSIAGQGRAPTTADLLQVADAAGLKRSVAADILAQTHDAVAQWSVLAETAGVTGETARLVAQSLRTLGTR